MHFTGLEFLEKVLYLKEYFVNFSNNELIRTREQLAISINLKQKEYLKRKLVALTFVSEFLKQNLSDATISIFGLNKLNIMHLYMKA